MNFSFGAPATSSAFSFGTPSTSSAGLLGNAPTPAATSGFSFGTPTTTTATTILGFGTPPVSSISGVVPFGGLTSSSAGFGNASSTTPSLGTSVGAGGISFGKTNSVANNISFSNSLLSKPIATTSSSFSFNAPMTTVGTAFGGLAPAPGPATTMTYKQLEDEMNRWMSELDEQEKVFVQLATQVNAWDRLLIDNGDKVETLNSTVQKVKLDQSRVEQEIDLILAQQRELMEMLEPLESSLASLAAPTYQQRADIDREHTFQLAESIDSQLKRMRSDLQQIIDHLNSQNSSGSDESNPINKIARILNAHMESLGWVEQQTGLLQRKVEDVSRQSEIRRKELERNFRLAYD